MSQSNQLEGEIYPEGEFGAEHGQISFDGVNYISFVNGSSFGIPAIIADEKYKAQGLPLTVLYVNPDRIAAMKVRRTR